MSRPGRALTDYAVNPRRIPCPVCHHPLGDRHMGGGHDVAFCRRYNQRFGRRCSTHVYLLRDDEGVCYAIPITQAQYEHLCMYEAQHGKWPAAPLYLQHLGIQDAA